MIATAQMTNKKNAKLCEKLGAYFNLVAGAGFEPTTFRL
jgi:hypothetical protein